MRAKQAVYLMVGLPSGYSEWNVTGITDRLQCNRGPIPREARGRARPVRCACVACRVPTAGFSMPTSESGVWMIRKLTALLAVLAATVLALSLIHISEPTRPY